MLDVTVAIPTKLDGQTVPSRTVLQIVDDTVFLECGEVTLSYEKSDFVDMVEALKRLGV